MAKLGIDLQEGFEGDEVIVKVNGADLLHQTGVRTKGVLGLADSAEVDVADGPLNVEICVANRGITRNVSVDGKGDHYLGVSLQNDDLQTIVADEPFGYG